MRTYIFTTRERRIIKDFLEGKVPLTDMGIEQIRSRIKSFSDLSSDVNLYLKLREAVETKLT